MKKKFLMILLLGLGLCFPSYAFAETITLKSGQKIDAKIIERTDEYIKIDFYGTSVTYWMYEIERIGEEEPSLPSSKETTLKKVDLDWYINKDFAFKMKKISGWKFKESKDIEMGILMLSLGFSKESEDGDFSNTLIINVSKSQKPKDYLKGEKFFSYADAAVDSATKNLNKLRFIKKPHTLLINNVKVREAIFEWEDEKNNEKFTNILMHSHPVETNSDLIFVFIFFKCKSKDYLSIQPHLEESLMSMEIAKQELDKMPLNPAEKRRKYLKYKDEEVRLDIYNPGDSNCPVVILIHGAAGIEGDRTIRYRGFATDLMNEDIIAINVHYFDSKRENWVKTIIQTIDYTKNISNADKNRIGLVGYSLGGTLALAAASAETKIKALAINSGYLPSGFTKKDAANLPKTLMISGTEDSSINTLNKLKQWFAELGKPFQMKINEGLGHNNIPISIFQENWDIIVKFFTNNL